MELCFAVLMELHCDGQVYVKMCVKYGPQNGVMFCVDAETLQNIPVRDRSTMRQRMATQ